MYILKKNIFNLIFFILKKCFFCKFFIFSFELNSMYNDCFMYYLYYICDKELYNVILC